MISCYLRSSSYGSWNICPHQYFLQYVLGLSYEGNTAANKGNVVHKAMELLARKRKAQQDGEDLADITQDNAIEQAIMLNNYDLNDMHLDECRKWYKKALKLNNGTFNPLNQDIVDIEKFFDISLEQPRFHYNYQFQGKPLEGYFSLKGHIDLITRHKDDNMLEVVDYKTGKKLNWATGEEKTYEDLKKDFQLRLYHYAANHLYPEYSTFLVTIVYINAGGPSTILFDKSDLAKTEDMVWERFDEMRKTDLPKWIWENWQCHRLCKFSKIHLNKHDELPICHSIRQELQQIGISKVIDKYATKATLTEYGAGGGQEDTRKL